MLTLNVPISGKKKKITEIFIFTLLCGASKGFMKALKARQSSVKIKIYVNFYFSGTFWNAQEGKG